MPYEAPETYEADLDGPPVRGEYEYEYAEGEGEAEADYEASGELLDEETEMDLTMELLDVASEGELDQFLGDLVRRVGGAASRFVRSPTGQQLVGALRGAARKALPTVGAAIGGRIAGPTGARIGSQLAQTAGRVFGLELEGLSPEDQEFEAARRFVRFASSAAHSWVRRGGSPLWALRRAARRHAPGLYRWPFGGRPGYAGGYRARRAWRAW